MEEKKQKSQEVTIKNFRKEFSEVIAQWHYRAFQFQFHLEICPLNHNLVNMIFTYQYFEREEETEKREKAAALIKKNKIKGKEKGDEHHSKELQSQNHFQIQSSCFVEFISLFLNSKNIGEMTFDCSGSSIIAIYILIALKSCQYIKSIIIHTDFFLLNEGNYTIISNPFLIDNIKEWKEIEASIHFLKMQFHGEDIEKTFEPLNQLNSLREVQLQIISLKEVEKDITLIIESILFNSKNLQKLSLEVFLEEPLPIICSQKFESETVISISYVYHLLKTVNPIKLMKYIDSFSMNRQNLLIPNCVEINENEYNVNLCQHEILQDIDPEKNEFNMLLRLMENSRSQNEKFVLKFSFDYSISLKKFVEITKILCSKKNLKSIELKEIRVSKQISALSLCKFIKCGKEYAKVNFQTFENGILDLKLDQISDLGMITLLGKNCFMKGASRIKQINISSNIIIGHLSPFSNYFKNSLNILEKVFIQVINQNCDLNFIILQIVKDRTELLNSTESFTFAQQDQSLNNNLQFQFMQNQTYMFLGPKYNKGETLKMMKSNELSLDLIEKLENYLNPIYHHADAQFYYQKLIPRFELFVFLRQFCSLSDFKKILPFQILVFFLIIAPAIPLNPHMLITDLYYD